MNRPEKEPPRPEGRMVVLSRTFATPRKEVFNAWIDARRLARWWGPRGFTNPVCALDARPGGAIRIHMQGPDGDIHPMTGLFREIARSRRLVFTGSALDRRGNPLLETLNTVTFEGHGGKTTVAVEARVLGAAAKAAPYLNGLERGWAESLDRLDDHLAKARGASARA